MRRVLLGVVLLWATQAAAAPEVPGPGSTQSAESEAEALLLEGTRLFTEEADYQAARDHFERAYARAPSWKALNGLALVDQEQGRLVEALQGYQRLLEEFATTLTETQRATLQKRIAKLEQRIGRLELVAQQRGAQLFVDGDEVGRAPLRVTRLVMPGSHLVLATLQGHQSFTRRVEISAGQRLEVAVELAREREVVVYRTRPARLKRRMPRWVPWVTAGAGVAMLGTGALLTRAAQQDFDGFDALVADASVAGQPAALVDQALRERGERRQLGAGVLYVAGGTAVVGALVLWVLNQPRAVPERGEPGVRPARGLPDARPARVAPVLGVGWLGARVTF